MARMTLVPTPPEQAEVACAGCGAPLVADQRYCLACGQPASPVRLAFLDVLQTEHNGSGGHAVERWPGAPTIEMSQVGYAPPFVPAHGANAWLRRYSGLLGLLSVLALCLLVGLLVGHWVTQGKAPAKQVIEVKGLTGAPAAAATTPAGAAQSGTTPAGGASGASRAKAEAEEAGAEAKETPAEKAPPPPPVKVTPAKIKKLSTTTGKKHQEEINSLGAQPIETG